MSESPLVQLVGLTKRYPGVTALDCVDMTMRSGHIHALVGENGAGKSTLIKMLAGVIKPNEGEILVDGNPILLATPQDSHRAGIAVVHQHTHLIPDLTIAENFALRNGYPRSALRTVSWNLMFREAKQATDFLIPGIDVRRHVRTLSGVEKQMVELSFGLAANPRLLILDEPTAVLPHAETDALFSKVKQYSRDGGCVLFVSHRLDEVFTLANDVTVLRDGQLVWCKQISDTSHEDLIQGMVGRSVSFSRDTESIPTNDVKLSITDLTDINAAFRDVSFTLNRGEIYGVYGLVGAGQSELCQALFGLRSVSHGEAKLDSAVITRMPPRSIVHSGVAYVPADRLSQGMFHQMTVGENMSIASLDSKTVAGWIRSSAEREENQNFVRDLRVKTLGVDQGVLQLSGGNQQKVLLARWLQTKPEVLILEEPTQGVDVGAKGEIHKIVLSLAKQGVTVLLVTSEIPELLALSHRVGVMREGRLVKELDATSTTEEELLRYALPDTESKQRALESADKVKKSGGVLQWLLTRRETGLALFLVVACVAFAAWLPAFRTPQNIQDILKDQSTLLIGALGMMLVIIAGGIDVSAGAILGLCAMGVAKLDQQTGTPAVLLPFAGMALGLVLGAGNGILSVLGRVHAIVITLGTLFIFRSLMIHFMGGRWIFRLSEKLIWLQDPMLLGATKILWLPIFAAIAALLVHMFLKHMASGRRLYAYGGNKESAAYVGIYARKVVPLAFGISGMMLGFAGWLHAGRYGQVQTNVGQGFEMKVIAAAVIGGTYINGGRGTVLGTMLGALFLGVVSNVLVLSGISTFWDNVVLGGMIVAAVMADAMIGRRTSGTST